MRPNHVDQTMEPCHCYAGDSAVNGGGNGSCTECSTRSKPGMKTFTIIEEKIDASDLSSDDMLSIVGYLFSLCLLFVKWKC